MGETFTRIRFQPTPTFMKHAASDQNLSLLVVRFSPPYPAGRSTEEVSTLTGLHPDLLRHYCRIGLLGESLARRDREPVFDDDALYELRRFEHYRSRRGMGRGTARLVCDLWRELARLRMEPR